MKTLIALDIDGVLMPWDDEAETVIQSPTRSVYDRYGKLTGFKDWKWNTDRSLRYLTFHSAEQHALIQQVGDVRWLTTWVKDNLHERYSKFTGFGPWETMAPSNDTRYEAEYLYRWWKMGYLYMWTRENLEYVAQYDRILWVDDDHNRSATREGLDEVNFQFAQLGVELYTVQPQGSVWSREEIELWIPSED